MASELLEIAVGSDQSGLTQSSKCGGKAVYVWDFVYRLQFPRFENLRNINQNDSDGKVQKISQGLPGGFLTVPLPGDIEDLSPVDRRNQQWRSRSSVPD